MTVRLWALATMYNENSEEKDIKVTFLELHPASSPHAKER